MISHELRHTPPPILEEPAKAFTMRGKTACSRDPENGHIDLRDLLHIQHVLSKSGYCMDFTEYALTCFKAFEMAAISTIQTLQLRDEVMQLVKRDNWAQREKGVIVVFCIVFIVAAGVLGLCISRWFSRRRAARPVV
jgi:hypothetical protein